MRSAIVLPLLLLACSKPADPAREPTSDSDASAATTTMETPVPTGGGPVAPIAIHHDNSDASVKAEKPSSAKCASDADCRLVSSYCQATPCSCYVLARSEPDRKCTTDRPVNCLVDPCGKKHARCRAGACVVGE